MRSGALKRLVTHTLFPTNAIRPILWGPLRGMRFRTNRITGLAPVYSGAERPNQRVFAEHIRLGDVAVDAGANWGLHTLYFSRLVGPTGKVVAVEPYPPAFDELRFHVGLNGLTNVECLGVALSDRNGTTTFNVTGEASMGGITRERETMAVDHLTVETRTLDSLGLPRLDFLKIDVEGADSLVLNGGRETIARLRPTILVELNDPRQDVACARILTELGYTITSTAGRRISRTDVGWPHPDGVWGVILAH